MKKTFKNFIKEFLPNKKQKATQKKTLQVLSLIVGSMFIAEGIISWFPEGLDKRVLIGIGVILIIMVVLNQNGKK